MEETSVPSAHKAMPALGLLFQQRKNEEKAKPFLKIRR
jgi:hypothetical protein